ncbi:MAG TPA: hypothetical protein VD735_01155 [Candidatus Saccharimonadales bacterium]|nr:hypothetical protein [Candidatus Saccharimonadales bacterium]
MNCPICSHDMKQVRESVTNNQKTGADYAEYTATIYHCEADDAWVTIEVPASKPAAD